MHFKQNSSNFSSSVCGEKVSAYVLVPKGTKFTIPFGGEHPHCKKFRNKENIMKYGGGTKYVYLLPVTEFIKHGVPKEGLLVKKSRGKFMPYDNYDPENDWITRHKKFKKYQDLAVWNKYLPNSNDVYDIIDKLKHLPEYYNLSIACIGYDSWSSPTPDVQLGLSGGVDSRDIGSNHNPKKHAAAREVWEELGLIGNGTNNSNKFPIEKCIFSKGNSFIFVIT